MSAYGAWGFVFSSFLLLARSLPACVPVKPAPASPFFFLEPTGVLALPQDHFRLRHL